MYIPSETSMGVNYNKAGVPIGRGAWKAVLRNYTWHLIGGAALTLVWAGAAYSHPGAPWSHHYKVCQHRGYENCRVYADQRVGQPIEGFGLHHHNYAGITHNH